ncbi:hypothetical protein [Fundicoccus culcitae]|uniref:PepSY domain-containing protein n=1 Tax=Fundicoccus culcitae TaxID=2969821 RepID=A0ABY5P5V3_9LACT|nr:hypothetical protein [Fundicoccus culcitae]UUX33929.1 hypothetical protein NRE15_13750 [Fundicoccus culcitae]
MASKKFRYLVIIVMLCRFNFSGYNGVSVQAQSELSKLEPVLSELALNNKEAKDEINDWISLVHEAQLQDDHSIDSWAKRFGDETWTETELSTEITSYSRLYETESQLTSLTNYPAEIELLFYNNQLFYMGLNYLTAYIPLEYTSDAELVQSINQLDALADAPVHVKAISYVRDPIFGDSLYWSIPVTTENQSNVTFDILQQQNLELNVISNLEGELGNFTQNLLVELTHQGLLSIDSQFQIEGSQSESPVESETDNEITLSEPTNWETFLYRNLKELTVPQEQFVEGEQLKEPFNEMQQLIFDESQAEISQEETNDDLSLPNDILAELNATTLISRQVIIDLFGQPSVTTNYEASEFLTYYGVDGEELIVLEMHLYQDQLNGFIYLNKDATLYQPFALTEKEIDNLAELDSLTLEELTKALGEPHSMAYQMPNDYLYSWISMTEAGNNVIKAHLVNDEIIELNYQTITIENE